MTEEYVTRSECQMATDKVLAKLESIDNRLFHDNGSVSIQTRLAKHDQILQALTWVTSIVVGALLVSIVSGVVVVLRALAVKGG